MFFASCFRFLTGTLYHIVLRMRNRRRLTSDEMHVGIGMLEVGSSQRNVAEHLDLSQSVVAKMWNRYQTNRNALHRHSGGRARQHRIFKIVTLVFQPDVTVSVMLLRYVMTSRTYEFQRKPSETVCTVPS